jgi:transposase
LLGKSSHLDTTSLTLQGNYTEFETVMIQYNDESLSSPTPVTSTPKARHGYSKDHRPDLKQVVLSLTTTGHAGFPVWMEALDGNSSDKTSFHETISKVKAFQKQLQESSKFIWVADSALYTVDKLLNYQMITGLLGYQILLLLPKHYAKHRQPNLFGPKLDRAIIWWH